jgi:hypothetical protein
MTNDIPAFENYFFAGPELYFGRIFMSSAGMSKAKAMRGLVTTPLYNSECIFPDF